MGRSSYHWPWLSILFNGLIEHLFPSSHWLIAKAKLVMNLTLCSRFSPWVTNEEKLSWCNEFSMGIFSWISKNCILKLHIKVCNWHTYRPIKVFPWQRAAMKIFFSSIEVNGRIQLWITITLIYIEIIPCNLVTASLLIMSLMGTKKMIIFFFSLFFAVWLRLASLCMGSLFSSSTYRESLRRCLDLEDLTFRWPQRISTKEDGNLWNDKEIKER